MKTDAGKFASSKNSLTHGLSAANIERFPESIREAYANFLAQQYEEWQPASANEEIFLSRYCFAQFQLVRAQTLVAVAQEDVLASPGDPTAEKRLNNFARHYRALERSAQTALKELRLLIADRLANTEANALLADKTNSLLEFPPVFPHHLVTEAKFLRQPVATVAQRFAEPLVGRLDADPTPALSAAA